MSNKPTTSTPILRPVTTWRVRRGKQQWQARALKIGGTELDAAGIDTRFVTVEITEGCIVIRRDPSQVQSLA
jgi:hypothetical protein